MKKFHKLLSVNLEQTARFSHNVLKLNHFLMLGKFMGKIAKYLVI